MEKEMNYKEALEYIHSTQKFGSNLGLDRISLLLEYMGNPHKKLKYVHIAGTNGKGSTAEFIRSILTEAGYRVGLFTSPSIQRFSERIRINETEISKADIARITSNVRDKVNLMIVNCGKCPTEFELVTAIGLQYFNEQCCDIVILETGLGGRLDATNIIDTPEVAVITTIDYDHMDILGDSLSEIAFEKAGIIKENGDVVVYPQEKEVEKVLERKSKDINASLNKVDLLCILPLRANNMRQVFDFESYKSLKISLLGEHQMKNAAVAVKVAEVLNSKGFKIWQESIRRGLFKTKWSGRFEILNEVPTLIIDGAHNIQGVKTLYENLTKYFPTKKITFVIGMLADKDYKAMLKIIMPIANKYITVTPDSSRALSADNLRAYIKSYCSNVVACKSVEEAIHTSLKLCANDEIICAFGSLYYIGEVREYFGFN